MPHKCPTGRIWFSVSAALSVFSDHRVTLCPYVLALIVSRIGVQLLRLKPELWILKLDAAVLPSDRGSLTYNGNLARVGAYTWESVADADQHSVRALGIVLTVKISVLFRGVALRTLNVLFGAPRIINEHDRHTTIMKPHAREHCSSFK